MTHSASAPLAAILDASQKYFATGETRPLDFRIRQLNRLKEVLKANEEALIAALAQDLHKSAYEAFTTEIGVTYSDITQCIKKLRGWAKPRKIKSPFMFLGAGSYIYPEPYGTVLIIGPFNYPVNLIIEPLIGAIAAGNCAVIKPSRMTPHVSQVIGKLIKEGFAPDYIRVVDPDRQSTAELIQLPFNYIFFTGSPAVGRIVMAAAAQNLVPVTLELGGKSPCIVDSTADLETAAKKIVWGKFINAGQTCVAPDYLVVHRQAKEKLIERIGHYIGLFFGPDPAGCPDFGRIVNQEQTERLCRLIDPARAVIGGNYDIASRYIAPTVLDRVGWDDAVMQEEIFGPVLPMLEYEDADILIRQIKKLPRPLALYAFTRNKELGEKLIREVSFGGGCLNDVLVHLGNTNLPFGGVGESGMGAYHGQKSFETFSHMKSILKRSFHISALMFYPPYNTRMLGMVRKLMR